MNDKQTLSLLFIYGTLLSPDNEFGDYLRQNSRAIASGKVRGQLFDLGDYPCAVPSPDHYLYGDVFQLNDPFAFMQLDEYEGVGNHQSPPNEFVRETVTVQTDTAELLCWIYWYNLPVGDAVPIPVGDYLAFLAGK